MKCNGGGLGPTCAQGLPKTTRKEMRPPTKIKMPFFIPRNWPKNKHCIYLFLGCDVAMVTALSHTQKLCWDAFGLWSAPPPRRAALRSPMLETIIIKTYTYYISVLGRASKSQKCDSTFIAYFIVEASMKHICFNNNDTWFGQTTATAFSQCIETWDISSSSSETMLWQTALWFTVFIFHNLGLWGNIKLSLCFPSGDFAPKQFVIKNIVEID